MGGFPFFLGHKKSRYNLTLYTNSALFFLYCQKFKIQSRESSKTTQVILEAVLYGVICVIYNVSCNNVTATNNVSGPRVR
jgi:hypothetical protein